MTAGSPRSPLDWLAPGEAPKRLPCVMAAPLADQAGRHAALLQACAVLVPDTALRLAHEAGGAPVLEAEGRPAAALPLVSLASRDGLAAFAIASRLVGIDIEPVAEQPDPPWNVLHPDEAAWIRAGSTARARPTDHVPVSQPASVALRFLTIWTAKEAYLKMLRTGLSREPASFAVRVTDSAFRVADPDVSLPCRGESRHLTIDGRACIVSVALLECAPA